MVTYLVCLSLSISQPIHAPAQVFSNQLLRDEILNWGITVRSDKFDTNKQWHALSACARVETLNNENSSSSGTAVAIGKRDGFIYYLTANHVVKELGKKQLDLFNREFYRFPNKLKELNFPDADVAYRFNQADLAIIMVDVGKKKQQPPIVQIPKPWDRPRQFPFEAISIGCSGPRPPTCTLESIRGKTLVRTTNEIGAFYWQTAEKTIAGRSGGPLIDQKGRLIGICAATQNNAGYYIHLDEIHAWLRTLNLQWIWE